VRVANHGLEHGRLADAGLADQEHEPATTGDCRVDLAPQLREHVVAPDETLRDHDPPVWPIMRCAVAGRSRCEPCRHASEA
jgi:hypothetical protein